ncbi:TPA: hypothetical protein L0122_001057 [Citrobacter freundii]|nr:hypothetical protein [Citrobacter freundii]
MHRIDTPTAQKDKFGAGKNGFTRGNPQTGTPATDLDDDFFDMLQEEMAGVVEASGIALDKSKRNQLLASLNNLFLSRTADIPGRLLNVKVISASGTYTPTAGTKSIIVESIGGGGASGNLTATGATENAISAAGSNGAYAKARYTSGFSSVAVTIGAGGTILGGGGGNGGDGGTTSFGSLLVCPGGKGSRAGTAKVPPFNEGAAQPSAVPTGSGILISSKGPYSTWPTVVALGMGSNFANSISSPLGGYGLGGDGVVNNTSSASQNGQAGSSGCVIVWEYA